MFLLQPILRALASSFLHRLKEIRHLMIYGLSLLFSQIRLMR